MTHHTMHHTTYSTTLTRIRTKQSAYQGFEPNKANTCNVWNGESYQKATSPTHAQQIQQTCKKFNEDLDTKYAAADIPDDDDGGATHYDINGQPPSYIWSTTIVAKCARITRIMWWKTIIYIFLYRTEFLYLSKDFEIIIQPHLSFNLTAIVPTVLWSAAKKNGAARSQIAYRLKEKKHSRSKIKAKYSTTNRGL